MNFFLKNEKFLPIAFQIAIKHYLIMIFWKDIAKLPKIGYLGPLWLYQPSRLQFGLHSATGIFQREMEHRLCRIPFVKVRVDDILVSGLDDEDHLKNLKAVLQALKEAGLTVKMKKCFFMQPEVE